MEEEGWKTLLTRVLALTATPAGKRVFARMGFVPTGYAETFLLPAMRPETKERTADKKSDVSMVCTYPGQNSLSGIDPGIASRVISTSEMTVKYFPGGHGLAA